MEDIRREDRRLFLREVLNPSRLLVASLLTFFITLGAVNASVTMPLFALPVIWFTVGVTSWARSVEKRFRNPQMKALWQGCEERLVRFNEVLAKMRKNQVSELQEMPKTIRAVGESVYAALRRADIIADEVSSSEHGLMNQPPSWLAGTNDPQSRELYRLADKNIAEYRTHFAGIIAGVKRTEAQAAVYMTTVDSLRMKMIGYRLVGRSPELSSQDFLVALAEARAQLQSIDTALDELDLGHYPKQISVIPNSTPPPVPEQFRNLTEQKLSQVDQTGEE